MFLLSPSETSHDIALAKFRIFPVEDRVHLSITIDTEDLKSEMNTMELSLELLQDYIEKHTSYVFQGVKEPFKLLDFKHDQDHVVINSVFIHSGLNMKDIEIENTCLNTIKNHSKMVIVVYKEDQKDFRMHKNRTKIKVSFE